jgi:hypothetical protein
MVQEHDLPAMHAKKKRIEELELSREEEPVPLLPLLDAPNFFMDSRPHSSLFHERPPVTCCSCSAQGDKLFGGFSLDLIRSEMKVQN